jgi:hypothetical protein
VIGPAFAIVAPPLTVPSCIAGRTHPANVEEQSAEFTAAVSAPSPEAMMPLVSIVVNISTTGVISARQSRQRWGSGIAR